MSENLEKLRMELAKVQKEKERYLHRLQRLENRKSYMEKKQGKNPERTARNHRLITRGAVVEHLIPASKEYTETEFYSLMEAVVNHEAVKQLITNYHPESGGEK